MGAVREAGKKARLADSTIEGGNKGEGMKEELKELMKVSGDKSKTDAAVKSLKEFSDETESHGSSQRAREPETVAVELNYYEIRYIICSLTSSMTEDKIAAEGSSNEAFVKALEGDMAINRLVSDKMWDAAKEIESRGQHGVR